MRRNPSRVGGPRLCLAGEHAINIVCLDTLVATLYREGLREVGAYQLTYERLRALAMSPEDTIGLLRTTIEEGAP